MIEGIKVETVHNLSGQFRKENVENVAKSTIATGIAEIDAALGGGLTPGVAYLGAMPSLGKSTFALQMERSH